MPLDGKVVILTKKGYMIGSYTLSKTETNYEKEQWYQEILENGRKITYSTGIETMFQEMTIHDNIQKYFYMGREILDYSGKNLGVMLIRLSEKKIWGKLAASMVTEEGGALYILDRNNDILMEYNEKYQKQLKELREQETVKEISENEITTGNLKDDFYYMEGELENDSNKLVYLVPQEIFPKRKQKDSPENSGNVTFGDWIHRLYHVIFFQKNHQTFGRSGTNSGKSSQWNGSFGRTSRLFSGDE